MKKITLILFATLLFISCNQQKTKTMETTANEQLVKTYFEHFNKHDWSAMADMYTETADFKDPSLGTGIVKQTRQQTIKKYSELNKVFLI